MHNKQPGSNSNIASNLEELRGKRLRSIKVSDRYFKQPSYPMAIFSDVHIQGFKAALCI